MRRCLAAIFACLCLIAAGAAAAGALAGGLPGLPTIPTTTGSDPVQQLTGLVPAVSVGAQTVSTPSVVVQPPAQLPAVSVPAQTVPTPPVSTPPASLPAITTPTVQPPSISKPALPIDPVKTLTQTTPTPVRPPSAVPPATPGTPAPAPAPTTTRTPVTATNARPTPAVPRPAVQPRSQNRPTATTTVAPGLTTTAPDSASANAVSPNRGRQGIGPAARRNVVVRFVQSIPRAIKILIAVLAALAGLLGIGMLAAFLSRRRLARHRTALLDDVDLLQRALLPSPGPRVGPVVVSTAFSPAEGLAAGGDFYDIVELEDGHVIAFLGDVCGHGRIAVEKAALARFTLRTLLAGAGTLAGALAEADRLLARDLDGLFATAIAVRISPDGRKVEVASAGHELPLRLGGGGGDLPAVSGPALGLGLELSDWQEATFELADDETLALFSDGLIEARLGDGSQIGRTGLATIAASARSAEQVIQTLEELAAVSDDLACITISRLLFDKGTTSADRRSSTFAGSGGAA